MAADIVDACYEGLKTALEVGFRKAVPYLRRLLRLLALPYCYFGLVNWQECNSSRLRVAGDLLHIFFRLKYFPDNYSFCRLWEKKREEWIYYYGSAYDAYQRARLEREVNRPSYGAIFSDKEVCQQLCQMLGIPMPKVLGVIDPSDHSGVKLASFIEQSSNNKIIIKPMTGKGGHGICLGFARNSGRGHRPRTCTQIEREVHSRGVYRPTPGAVSGRAGVNKFGQGHHAVHKKPRGPDHGRLH
jgi:hypothetical protein